MILVDQKEKNIWSLSLANLIDFDVEPNTIKERMPSLHNIFQKDG